MKQGTIIDATLIAAPSSTLGRPEAERGGATRKRKGSGIGRCIRPRKVTSGITASWCYVYGMKVHNCFAEAKGKGVDKDTGLIHSVETTAANVHDITKAADLLYGEVKVVYADAGYRGIEKREEMAGKSIEFRVAMRPGKYRALPDTHEGRLQDLVEAAKAHICAKAEHPFRVI